MSTYDNERQSYLEAYTPDVTPDQHWSTSPEWMAYLKAKADATHLYPIGSTHGGRIAETDEMQAALKRFQTKFPPVESTPAPTQALSARDAELQAAQIDLRRGRSHAALCPSAGDCGFGQPHAERVNANAV